jgi:zinc transport system substrate-binding protein
MFVKAIGGDKVDVTLMVLPGNSAHTYEPKPSQMTAVSKAQLYFAIDVEFEHTWLDKFKSLNATMKIIDSTKNIHKIHMAHDDHDHDHEGDDPHVWTSPTNVGIIGQNIYEALVAHDASNKMYYKKNLDIFLALVKKTDIEIKKSLSALKDKRTFMVFHPSWGYFAKDYNLKQVAIEIEGKSPKPRELVSLIKEAEAQKVNAIFTQPEFSDSSAKIIANELHIPVIKVSPMAQNWSENLINISKNIAGLK